VKGKEGFKIEVLPEGKDRSPLDKMTDLRFLHPPSLLNRNDPVEGGELPEGGENGGGKNDDPPGGNSKGSFRDRRSFLCREKGVGSGNPFPCGSRDFDLKLSPLRG
jgi:hypothetical protein